MCCEHYVVFLPHFLIKLTFVTLMHHLELPIMQSLVNSLEKYIVSLCT